MDRRANQTESLRKGEPHYDASMTGGDVMPTPLKSVEMEGADVLHHALRTMLIYWYGLVLQEKEMVEKLGYPEMCVNKTLLREFYRDVSEK